MLVHLQCLHAGLHSCRHQGVQVAGLGAQTREQQRGLLHGRLVVDVRLHRLHEQEDTTTTILVPSVGYQVDDLEASPGLVRLLQQAPQSQQRLADDVQILPMLAHEEQQRLHGARLNKLLVEGVVHCYVGDRPDGILEDVLVAHERASRVQQDGHGVQPSEYVAVRLGAGEVGKGAERQFCDLAIVIGLALVQGRKDFLDDPTLAELFPDLWVRGEVAEDAARLLHQDGVVLEGPHRLDCRLDEAQVQDVLTVLSMPAETTDDAQGSLVETTVGGVGLQDGRQGGEPAGREQRVLHLDALHGAGPDRGGHRRTRVDHAPALALGGRAAVEGGHERVDAAIVQDCEAELLLYGKVAEEAADRDDEGRSVDAPLQHVNKHGDATTLLQGTPVACSLGHERQGRDRIVQNRQVVLVLRQQVHDDGDGAQSREDGVRAIHHTKKGEDLQAALDHGGVARVGLEQGRERGQQALLDRDVLVCGVLAQEPGQQLDDEPDALGGREVLMRPQPGAHHRHKPLQRGGV
mmetsp:Transcript_77354/g.203019  ORF Transcript_77354/g.203019 Transcript_77354/m.203019 type:complete len:520 (+) Transcript_77354:260-1819(+)